MQYSRTQGMQVGHYTQHAKKAKATMARLGGREGQCHVCGTEGQVFKRSSKMICLPCFKWSMQAKRQS